MTRFNAIGVNQTFTGSRILSRHLVNQSYRASGLRPNTVVQPIRALWATAGSYRCGSGVGAPLLLIWSVKVKACDRQTVCPIEVPALFQAVYKDRFHSI